MQNVSTSLLERFDRVRAAYPDCGFALYAYEPNGPVTLEIITPEVGAAPYTFIGATAEEAMDKAFPQHAPAREFSVVPTTPEPTISPEPAGSIFD